MRRGLLKRLVTRTQSEDQKIEEAAPAEQNVNDEQLIVPVFKASLPPGPEGRTHGPGRELASILLALEHLHQKRLPDYLAVLLCSLCSRVDCIDDIEKSRALLHVFLRGVMPPYPRLTQFIQGAQLPFLDESESLISCPVREIDKCVFRFISTESNQTIIKRTTKQGELEAEGKVFAFHCCEIMLRKWRSSLQVANWFENEDTESSLVWITISAPTRHTKLNEKFSSYFEESVSLSEHTLICNMLLTMHAGEKAVFGLVPDLSDSVTQIYEIQIVNLEVCLSSGSNLFTPDLSLQRFYGSNIYSNFARPDPPFYKARWSINDMRQELFNELNQYPILTMEPEVFVTIRLRSQDAPTSKGPLNPIYSRFSDLTPQWKWIVLTAPPHANVTFTCIDESKTSVYHLVWTVDETSRGVNSTANLISPTRLLRRLFRQAVCSIKTEIAVISQVARRALDTSLSGERADVMKFTMNAIVTGGKSFVKDLSQQTDPAMNADEQELVLDPSTIQNRPLIHVSSSLCADLPSFTDTLMGGNVFVTRSLANLMRGFENTECLLPALNLVPLKDADRQTSVAAEADGYYVKQSDRETVVYTVALVSGFANWGRTSNRILSKAGHIIDLGPDEFKVAINPCAQALIKRAKEPSKQAVACTPVSLNIDCHQVFYKPLQMMLQFSLPSLAAITCKELLDPTIMWPSLCIHHLPSAPTQEIRSITPQVLKLLPTRKPAVSFYQWIQQYATYVLHSGLDIGECATVCHDVFGQTVLVIPLAASLKKLGNNGCNVIRCVVVPSTPEVEIKQALSGILPASYLQDGSEVYNYLVSSVKLAQKAHPMITSGIEPYLTSFVVTKVPEAQCAKSSFTQILGDIQSMTDGGTWAIRFPTTLAETILSKNDRTSNYGLWIRAAWAYLVITSKFGESRTSRTPDPWCLGMVPATAEDKYLISIEERAAQATGSATTGNVSSQLVADLIDYDHILIEECRYQIADILSALHLLWAEEYSEDRTLNLFLADEDTARSQLEKLLGLGYSTVMAPHIEMLMDEFKIKRSYEEAILDRCRQLIEGIAYLSVRERRTQVIGYCALFRGAVVSGNHNLWDLTPLPMSIRSAGPDSVKKDIQALLSTVLNINHEIYRSDLGVDRIVYEDLQISDQYSNMQTTLSQAAKACSNEYLLQAIRNAYIRLLDQHLTTRKSMKYPNSMSDKSNKENQSPSKETDANSLGFIAQESEFLYTAYQATGMTGYFSGVLTAIHLMMVSLSSLLHERTIKISTLWQVVQILCETLFHEDSLNFKQPLSISYRLIGMALLPLRLVSGYHHVNGQFSYSLTADILTRLLRSKIPFYTRAKLSKVEDGRPAYEDDLLLLLSLPVGPPAATPLTDFIDINDPDYSIWPGVDAYVHRSWLETQESVSEPFVASLLEVNYLPYQVHAAWNRMATTLLMRPPSLSTASSIQNRSLGFGSTFMTKLVALVLKRSRLWSAGDNGQSGCLGLGGIPRVWQFDPTMAFSDEGLFHRNELMRQTGKDIWYTSTFQPIMDIAHVTDDITKVACGEFHTVALNQSGQLIVFGSTKHGQLGFTQIRSRPEILPANIVRADYGDRRILDYHHTLRKKERLKAIRVLLKGLVGYPPVIQSSEEYAEKSFQLPWSIHTPLLLTLHKDGNPLKVIDIACGASFTVCITSNQCLVMLYWPENTDVADEDVDFTKTIKDKIQQRSERAPAKADKVDVTCSFEPGLLIKNLRRAGSLRSSRALDSANASKLSSYVSSYPAHSSSNSSLHPLVLTGNVTGVAAGVAHWAAVLDEGYLLMGGENNAEQMGPWHPHKDDFASGNEQDLVLRVWRIDCFCSEHPTVPSASELSQLVTKAGPEGTNTGSGGTAIVFSAEKLHWIIFARPYRQIQTMPCLSNSPTGMHQHGEAGSGPLLHYRKAKFIRVDCGESHTLALLSDRGDKYAVSWGCNDLNQQLPNRSSLLVNLKSKSPRAPSLLRVDHLYTNCIAGSTASAVGTKTIGDWYGTQQDSHLGWDNETVKNGSPGSLDIHPSKLSITSFQIAKGRVKVFGEIPFGQFLNPRLFEESVARAWRDRLQKRAPETRGYWAAIPNQVTTAGIGVSHMICVTDVRAHAESEKILESMVYKTGPILGRSYKTIEDVLKNYSSSEGWMRRGPPAGQSVGSPKRWNQDKDAIPVPLPLADPIKDLTSGSGVSSPGGSANKPPEWLQKGFQGVAKVVDMIVTNIVQSTDLPKLSPRENSLPRRKTLDAISNQKTEVRKPVNYFHPPPTSNVQPSSPPQKRAVQRRATTDQQGLQRMAKPGKLPTAERVMFPTPLSRLPPNGSSPGDNLVSASSPRSNYSARTGCSVVPTHQPHIHPPLYAYTGNQAYYYAYPSQHQWGAQSPSYGYSPTTPPLHVPNSPVFPANMASMNQERRVMASRQGVGGTLWMAGNQMSEDDIVAQAAIASRSRLYSHHHQHDG